MLRTELYADPHNIFLHDAVLDSCRRNAAKTALVDTSCGRRLTYAEYGAIVESVARGLAATGIQPGEVVAIFLANSWEFCAAFHAAMLAGAIPTLLNPTCRERELRYQLENSGAVLLITDGGNIEGINLGELPLLRRVYTTRQPASGSEPFVSLLRPVTAVQHKPDQSSDQILAALPYSSGTTGLPKGVMLSHYNLVANVYQYLGPNATKTNGTDTILCCLPLYHIYGLNVILNPTLILGAKLVLMPRFNVEILSKLLIDEAVTMMPLVPPAINALCLAA
jgi:acyl-CoA synthetase (AMP-forming)/AMP-acid ligase II